MMRSVVFGIAGLLALALAVAAGAFFLATPGDPAGDEDERAGACSPGEEACLPDVKMEDRAGEVWDREALEGKVVIVNFWATWCRPCVDEVPELAQIYESYAEEDVVLLGVMADRPTEEEFEDFAERTGLIYPVIPAGGELLRAYGTPDILPTTHVYGRGGRRALDHQGMLTADQLRPILDELLAEDPPGAAQEGVGSEERPESREGEGG